MDPMNVPSKFEVRSFTRSWDNSGYLKNFGQSLDTPFKVTQGLDFGTLGPILHRFGDIAGFLRSRVTPPLFRPNFGGVPGAPDGPCRGQPEQRRYAIRPWNYFRKIPTYVITVPERYTQTDRRTDNIWSQYRALH